MADLSHEKIAFTGAFLRYGPAELRHRAECLGATVVGSVTPETTILVKGLPFDGRTKMSRREMAAAKHLGPTSLLRIITEDQFIDLLEINPPADRSSP